MIEQYYTINREYGPVEMKEKGSKFISYLYPISSGEEAEKKLGKLKKEFYDATHVCFAFRTGEGEETYRRYNDDGEPSGTAGMPIYQEITRKDLYNVLIAVIRYFGGVKLGTGGLQRAYSLSARLVVDTAEITTIGIKKIVTLPVPFSFTGEMMHMINMFDAKIISQEYNQDGTNMKLAIPTGKVTSFQKYLTEKSAGKIVI